LTGFTIGMLIPIASILLIFMPASCGTRMVNQDAGPAQPDDPESRGITRYVPEPYVSLAVRMPPREV
jgi:hypothetical protein